MVSVQRRFLKSLEAALESSTPIESITHPSDFKVSNIKMYCCVSLNSLSSLHLCLCEWILWKRKMFKLCTPNVCSASCHCHPSFFVSLIKNSWWNCYETLLNFKIVCNQWKYTNEDIFHHSLQNILLNVASAFLSFADHFKLYSSFCASHSKAQKLLHPTEGNQALQQFLAARNPRQQHSNTLESYLIKPIQRILKYPLLLQQLRNLCDTNTEEYRNLVGK